MTNLCRHLEKRLAFAGARKVLFLAEEEGSRCSFRACEWEDKLMDLRGATIDLNRLNLETEEMDKTDYMVWLGSRGVPIAILTRLEDLWGTTKEIGSTRERLLLDSYI